jgi:hypothetical protein
MASNSIPPSCKVVLAGTIAKGLLAEVQEGLSGLQKRPALVGFLANDDPAAQMYADWSAKTCIEKYVSDSLLSCKGFFFLAYLHIRIPSGIFEGT